MAPDFRSVDQDDHNKQDVNDGQEGNECDDFIEEEDEESNKWTVTPYHLNLAEDRGRETILLFDFPSNLQVCLNDMSIQMSCFDYLNPLILTPVIRSRIEIFVSSTGRSVTELDCFRLSHPTLNIDNLLNEPLFYPPNYAINYLKPSLTRTRQLKTQFVHLIDRRSRPASIPALPPPNLQYRPLSDIFIEDIVNRLPNVISPPSSSFNTGARMIR